uniref:Putative ovule protein n=1 Tax=Solanum chacoense TaxID=4108 RepID=A0A0V0GH48_SOLCH
MGGRKQGLEVDVQKPYDFTIHSKETSTRSIQIKLKLKAYSLIDIHKIKNFNRLTFFPVST